MKITAVILSFLTFFTCENSLSKKTKQNNNMTTYFLNYNFKANSEIFINGILISKTSEENGVSNSSIYLNPYIQKSGTQTLTIKINKFSNDTLHPDYLKDISLEINSSNNFHENQQNFEINVVKKCILPQYKTNQDSVFYSWSFDANVNYELNTLDIAGDLTNEDLATLTKDVLDKYQEIHDILNSGNIKDYENLFKESLIKEAKSMNYNSNETNSYVNEQITRASKAKDTMLPLQKSSLMIHLNKKTLELITDKGQSPLMSINKDEYKRVYGFILFRNLNTGKLEVY